MSSAVSCLKSANPPEPEGVVVQGLVEAIREWELQNPGRTAGSWNDIAPYVNWTSVAGYYLQNQLEPPYTTYVFPKPGLFLPAQSEEKIVLIRSTPTLNGEAGAGRRAVIRASEGLRFKWLKEENVQQMLREASVTLPKPDHNEYSIARESMEAAVAEKRNRDRATQSEVAR